MRWARRWAVVWSFGAGQAQLLDAEEAG